MPLSAELIYHHTGKVRFVTWEGARMLPSLISVEPALDSIPLEILLHFKNAV